MTHSLHRTGSLDSLKNDYVMIARTSKVNRAATAPVLTRVAEIVFEVGISNTGSSVLETNMALGLDKEEFIKHIPSAHGMLCSFSSKEQLREVLRRIKEADLGISITVSGLMDEVIPLAQELGIKPHTANLSMGIIGRTDLLAEEEVLEMTTMCGHALISANLVRKGITEVANGTMDACEASKMLGKPCVCGIYNLDRSVQLLKQRAAERKASQA